jgi:hypothetical protein
MPVSWVFHGAVLTLKVSDVVTNQEIEQAFAEALARDPSQSGLRLLWDARESLTPLSSDDLAWRFDLVSSLAERGTLVRLALLARAREAFVIELARTQLPTMLPGLPTAVFSDAAEALAWLEK